MSRWQRQRGEGQMGCLVGIIFLLIGAFIAYKLIPVKVRAAEFRQEIIDQAKAAGMRNDDKIMAAILRKAEDENLPVGKENVVIKRTANTIVIDVDYVVPVEFPGYKYNWSFSHHAENPIF